MLYQFYQRCNCGAITIDTNKGTYCCRETNLPYFFSNLILDEIEQLPQSYCCNHCINRYDLDLCGCGSGADYGRCTNEFDACQHPMQIIGEYDRFIAQDSWLKRR